MGRFGKFMMGVGLASGIAGGEMMPKEAHAEDTAPAMEQLAHHLDSELEKTYPGYTFRVGAYTNDSIFKKGPGYAMVSYQFRPEHRMTWTNGEVKVPRELSEEEIDAMVIEAVGLAIDAEQDATKKEYQETPRP